MISPLHKICLRLTLLTALAFTGNTLLLSQNYNIRTFTTLDGLTHNNVREMTYDSTGFLWIATWDGLNRYDGYEFRHYSHNPDDSTSLPFFSVNRVIVDGSDNLWVLTDNGIAARLDRSTNKFFKVTKVNSEKIPPSPNMACDNHGNIWIISYSVLVRVDHKTGIMELYSIVTPGNMKNIDQAARYNVSVLGSNSIWLVGPSTYEAEIDNKRKEIRIINSYKLFPKELPPEKIIRNYDHAIWFTMSSDIKGNKWLFSNMGLFLVDERTKEIHEFSGDVPFRDFRGRDMYFWGSMTGGVFFYRQGADSIMSFPVSESQLLKYLTYRNKDILWYSNTSLTGNPLGITRVIFTPGFFHKYKVDTETDKLPAVYSVTVDDKKQVWLGIRGRDHLVVLTPENKIIKKYTPASSLPGFYGPPRTLRRTSSGIWVGYFWQMLLFYDYKSDTFREFKAGSNQYRALELRNDGKVYTGHTELILFDPVKNEKKVLMESLSDGGNFRFALGKDSILWGGLSGGRILRYDPRKDSVKLYIQKNITNNTEDICQGEDGYLWLAMLGGGLVRYNPETGDRKVYTTSDGLANNTVYSILKDKKDNLWVSTNSGISRLNPNTGTIRNFGLSEGLDIVEFNSGASFTDEDGRFYFGGMGGAVSFHPDSINEMEANNSGESLFLTGLTVSGRKKSLDGPFYKFDTLKLDKGENNFHLSFAITDFPNSEKTIYRYMLKGIDNDWVVTDHTNRNINYASLSPGDYSLTVEATDRNGEWAMSKRLIVIIPPYFYQRRIFFLFVGLAIFALFYTIISLYMRNLNNKSIKAQDELRLQALRGQMNPHFIFNSLNSINYFISNNDKISANRYIADFSRLIRTILSNMGTDFVPFGVELGSIKDYLEIEHLRFGDKFDFAVDVRGVDEIESLHVFPGLVQPFIENAIWHGVRALENRKGFIRIRMTLINKEKLTCVIEDDGIGREAARVIQKDNGNHKSRGIGIVLERLHIISKMRGINYGLEISDLYPGKNETGTRVRIDIPVKISI